MRALFVVLLVVGFVATFWWWIAAALRPHRLYQSNILDDRGKLALAIAGQKDSASQGLVVIAARRGSSNSIR